MRQKDSLHVQGYFELFILWVPIIISGLGIDSLIYHGLKGEFTREIILMLIYPLVKIGVSEKRFSDLFLIRREVLLTGGHVY